MSFVFYRKVFDRTSANHVIKRSHSDVPLSLTVARCTECSLASTSNSDERRCTSAKIVVTPRTIQKTSTAISRITIQTAWLYNAVTTRDYSNSQLLHHQQTLAAAAAAVGPRPAEPQPVPPHS